MLKCNSLCFYFVPCLHKFKSHVKRKWHCTDTMQAIIHLTEWTQPFSLPKYCTLIRLLLSKSMELKLGFPANLASLKKKSPCSRTCIINQSNRNYKPKCMELQQVLFSVWKHLTCIRLALNRILCMKMLRSRYIILLNVFLEIVYNHIWLQWR